MWASSVTIDGADVGLDVVIADVVIRQGRTTIDDQPTASTIQLRLENVTRDYSEPFTVGVSIAFEADGARRFTGTITDASLDDDVLTVIGVGVLASLSRFTVGASDWPAEPWSDRVARAFAEAGLDELLILEYDAGFDPLLAARPGEPVKLSDYLQQLADDVGAAIADTPGGSVLVQEISSRTAADVLAWKQVPVAASWTTAACAWQDATSLGAIAAGLDPLFVTTIDPADVLYVPEWEQTLAIENQTAVTLGDGATIVTATVADSVDTFGPFPGEVTTELELPADGSRRATDRVDRRAYPRWAISSLTTLRGYVLAIGRQVIVSDFPPGSPFETWAPVVEGWTDKLSGGPGGSWTCDLAVSDPQLSGLILPWGAVPSSLAWNEVDPACRWLDAIELGDLYPSTRKELAHAC